MSEVSSAVFSVQPCIILALICIVLALIKWLRPIGKRSKDHAIYMFSVMMHRALLAPMVWILVTLLDGKIFICAFGMSMPDNTAVSRYVRCYSQAIGWSIFLFFIILGALGRLIKPCFNDHATNLRTCVLRLPLSPEVRYRRKEDMVEEEEERLHGITQQDQMDQLLQTWFQCKPELDVTRMAYRPRVCVTWEDDNGKTLYSDV
uniref:Uncharacterized protein n=1 Tax=Oncorhynchus tshawytscha TaxID=74940 RepID=A0AAZ3RX83_ONCTS